MPARPSLVTVLYDGPHYRAEWIDGPRGGLCVTRKRKRGGALLTGATAPAWRVAIETAIDAAEASSLCRAILA